MSDNIIMAKYQGLGNDYLILDAVRNRSEEHTSELQSQR